MELNDTLIFLQTKLPSFDVGPQVIGPPQTTALPTSLEPYMYISCMHAPKTKLKMDRIINEGEGVLSCELK